MNFKIWNDILDKPQFVLSNSQSVTVLEGTDMGLNLSAIGNPEVESYQYWKGEQPLALSDRIRIGGPVLNISRVERSDAGKYSCEAMNSEGSDVINVEIFVKYPAEIVSISESMVVDLGSNVTIQCKADAYPRPKSFITWERENYDWSNARRASGDSIGYLHIPAVAASDSGTFTCVADNGIGASAQRDTVLLVRHGPIIDRSPRFTKAGAEIGHTAVLHCNVKAEPEVEIRWRRPGAPLLPENEKYHATMEKIGLNLYQVKKKFAIFINLFFMGEGL